MRGMSWAAAIVRAGAVPAAYVPEASMGRRDIEGLVGSEPVEDRELALHPLEDGFRPPAAFLDGIQYWRVAAYDGVTPVVRAYVAAAVRRRGSGRRTGTALEASREIVVTRFAALRPAVRRALEASGADACDLSDPEAGQPVHALEHARRTVEQARVELEREVGERFAAALGADEWLVVDGVLSESAVLAAHPRTLGVIKSHGAQYFEGAELERALTLPDGQRTSVFRPRGRARHAVYSWYLRLWPWEGNDLMYGLLRVEVRAAAEARVLASRVAGWLYAERAPLSTPDARFDRLLYPIHDVETYLRTRAPRDLLPAPGSRLPRTGS